MQSFFRHKVRPQALVGKGLPGVEEMTENRNGNRSTVLIVEDEFLIALDLEAAMSGLCGEGAWEAAIGAIQMLDLRPLVGTGGQEER